MDDLDLKLLLLQIPGVGNSYARRLLNEYGVLFRDSDYFKFFIENSYSVKPEKLLDSVNRIKEKCLELGVQIIINENLHIPDSPIILFLKGNNSLLKRDDIIAVAGTRTPSLEGEGICRDFSKVVCKSGAVLVTGFANGCDKICQNIFFENSKPSIAVLPMGYNPALNRFIEENNLLFISEYSPYTSVKKYMCVNRNRIIAGISRCLFIPEIKLTGGSYHTVKYAKEKDIPIAYGTGNLDVNSYRIKRVKKSHEFDLFIKKSLK